MTPKEVSTINFGDDSDSFFENKEASRPAQLDSQKFETPITFEGAYRSRETGLGETAGKSTTSSGKWGKVVSKIVEELKDHPEKQETKEE